MENKKTIVFDFDGVIHSYKSGWQGTTNIPDEPVKGIREAIKILRSSYKIVVVSTRCFQEGGIEAIKRWLKKHIIEVDDVLKEKPPAIMYVDDNAVCFDGNPKHLIKQIGGFKNWMDKKADINYKEQIEKVAINAGKARVMAKEVGLLPIGNWKHGLRNMRNMHTGDLLQGKELSEAKAKLGASSNNAYQKIKAESRKLPSNTEIGGILSRKTGNIKGTVTGGIRKGTVDSPYVNGKFLNMHTHPYNSGEDKYESVQNAMKTFWGKDGKGKTVTRLESQGADERLDRFVSSDDVNRKLLNKRNLS